MGQHGEKLSPLPLQGFAGRNVTINPLEAYRFPLFVADSTGAGLDGHHAAIFAHQICLKCRGGQFLTGQKATGALVCQGNGGWGGNLMDMLPDKLLPGPAHH